MCIRSEGYKSELDINDPSYYRPYIEYNWKRERKSKQIKIIKNYGKCYNGFKQYQK